MLKSMIKTQQAQHVKQTQENNQDAGFYEGQDIDDIVKHQQQIEAEQSAVDVAEDLAVVDVRSAIERAAREEQARQEASARIERAIKTIEEGKKQAENFVFAYCYGRNYGVAKMIVMNHMQKSVSNQRQPNNHSAETLVYAHEIDEAVDMDVLNQVQGDGGDTIFNPDEGFVVVSELPEGDRQRAALMAEQEATRRSARLLYEYSTIAASMGFFSAVAMNGFMRGA